MDREGILFIGDEGTIAAGFLGQDPQLFAKGKREPLPVGGAAERPRAATVPGSRPSRAANRHPATSSTPPRSPIPSTSAPWPCGPAGKSCSTART